MSEARYEECRFFATNGTNSPEFLFMLPREAVFAREPGLAQFLTIVHLSLPPMFIGSAPII